MGAGGIKSLAAAKAPMSMGEILEVLLSKARVEAEDAQRVLLGALNGLAALMLLEPGPHQTPMAVQTYRQVSVTPLHATLLHCYMLLCVTKPHATLCHTAACHSVTTLHATLCHTAACHSVTTLHATLCHTAACHSVLLCCMPLCQCLSMVLPV